MVGGESDFIASICCKIKSTITTFTPLFLERHKVRRAIYAGEIFFYFRLCFHDANGWTNRRKWAGGLIGWVWTCGRNRWADAARDVICDVTQMKWQFLGPRMETKQWNHARSDMEEPRQLPRAHASDKNMLCPLPGRPEDPGLVTQKFHIFYMMKFLNKPSEVSLRIHWVGLKLQQKRIVVTDGLTSLVTSFVTSDHWNANF